MANALLDILSSLFATLAKAYGKIRNYQIVVSLTLFLNFPLSYVALKVGYPPLWFCGLLHCFDALGDYTLPIDRWYV